MSNQTIKPEAASVSARTVVAVAFSGVAGIMVLSAVILVLVRCHTKRRRLSQGLEARENRRELRTQYSNSGESFIQSPPFTVPDSPEITVPITREPAGHFRPISTHVLNETSVVVHPTDADPNPSVTQSLPNGEMEAEEPHIPSTSQADTTSRPQSAASLYSALSLPRSQHSLVLRSTDTTRLSIDRTRLSNIPASPPPHSPPSPNLDVSSNSPLQVTLKQTGGPMFPLLSGTHSLPAQMPLSPAFAIPRRWSMASIHGADPGDIPPSVFRRRRSQADTSCPERYSAHEPPLAAPPVPARPSNEPLRISTIETFPNTPPRSPLRPHMRKQRKRRTESLRPRPHENYASIRYVQSRGPEELGEKDCHRVIPTTVNARLVLPPTPSTDYSIGELGEEQFESPTPNMTHSGSLPTALRYPRTRPAPLSPTWSTFRNSPGWV